MIGLFHLYWGQIVNWEFQTLLALFLWESEWIVGPQPSQFLSIHTFLQFLFQKLKILFIPQVEVSQFCIFVFDSTIKGWLFERSSVYDPILTSWSIAFLSSAHCHSSTGHFAASVAAWVITCVTACASTILCQFLCLLKNACIFVSFFTSTSAWWVIDVISMTC